MAARPELSSTLRGSVRVRDERDTSFEDGAGRLNIHRGRITATFGRLGSQTGTRAAGLPLGLACLGLTSRPIPAVGTATSGLGALAVEGTALGRVTVPSRGPGRFGFEGEPLLSSGVRLRVEAQGDTFPSFSEVIDTVGPLEMLAPDPRGSPGFGNGQGVEFRWVPGNGDAVWLEVAPLFPPGTPASGGKVLCRVVDDGCHRIPDEAVLFLEASGVDRFVAIVRRERVRLATVGTAEVLLEAASSWRFDLARTGIQP